MRVVFEYLIVAVFAAQGCMIAKAQKCNGVKTVFVALSFCFGGGFWIRDLILLQGAAGIWVFHNLNYVLFAVVCIILITVLHSQKVVLKNNLAIRSVDLLGSLLWIIDGIERAMRFSDNMFVIVACGLCTAFGGGIIGKFIANVNIKEIYSYKRIYTISSVVIAMYLLKAQSTIIVLVSLTAAFGMFFIWRTSSDISFRKDVITSLNEIILPNVAMDILLCIGHSQPNYAVYRYAKLLAHPFVDYSRTIYPAIHVGFYKHIAAAKHILYHYRLPKSKNLTNKPTFDMLFKQKALYIKETA